MRALQPMPSSPGFRRRRTAGFTFVEVLIVVLIMGIAAALTVPMFGQTDATRLRAAANLLVADLGYAQVESISHGDDPRLVVFDLDSGSYRIAAVSDPDTPITNPAGNQPYVMTFGTGRAHELAGVSIQGHALDGDDRLQFGIYGQLDQTDPATITLASGGASITITLDPTSGEASVGAIE